MSPVDSGIASSANRWLRFEVRLGQTYTPFLDTLTCPVSSVSAVNSFSNRSSFSAAQPSFQLWNCLSERLSSSAPPGLFPDLTISMGALATQLRHLSYPSLDFVRDRHCSSISAILSVVISRRGPHVGSPASNNASPAMDLASSQIWLLFLKNALLYPHPPGKQRIGGRFFRQF